MNKRLIFTSPPSSVSSFRHQAGGGGGYFSSYKVSSVVAATVLHCFRENTPLMPAITHSAVAR